jgi:hypothetical protein
MMTLHQIKKSREDSKNKCWRRKKIMDNGKRQCKWPCEGRTWQCCRVQSQFSDIKFSDYFTKTVLCNLVTVFAGTKSVTKSRLHCIFHISFINISNEKKSIEQQLLFFQDIKAIHLYLHKKSKLSFRIHRFNSFSLFLPQFINNLLCSYSSNWLLTYLFSHSSFQFYR